MEKEKDEENAVRTWCSAVIGFSRDICSLVLLFHLWLGHTVVNSFIPMALICYTYFRLILIAVHSCRGGKWETSPGLFAQFLLEHVKRHYSFTFGWFIARIKSVLLRIFRYSLGNYLGLCQMSKKPKNVLRLFHLLNNFQAKAWIKKAEIINNETNVCLVNFRLQIIFLHELWETCHKNMTSRDKHKNHELWK